MPVAPTVRPSRSARNHTSTSAIRKTSLRALAVAAHLERSQPVSVTEVAEPATGPAEPAV